MIYIQQYYMIDNEAYKPVNINFTFDFTLEESINYVEELVSKIIPLVYLKEKGSRDLLEVRLINNQVIISYVLDLFDFEKEFNDD